MPSNSRKLEVQITSSAKDFDRGFQKAQRSTESLSKQLDTANKTGVHRFNSGLDIAKQRALQFGAAVAGAFAAAKVVAFARDSIRAASDLGESINAVQKIFGDASDTVLEFGRISATAVGLSASQFQQMAAVTGQLLQGFGLSAQEAASWTIQLTQRAADLASVMNTDVSDALGAIQAALRGETEPIRRYVGAFSQAEVAAFALNRGLVANTSELVGQTKAMATLEFIMSKTDKAAGDFSQTSGDLANATRQATAEWEDAKASFGSAFQPVATFFVKGAAQALLNLRSKFDDAAWSANQMQKATRNISDAFRTGRDPFTALADSLLDIAQHGDLTREEFLALSTTAGLTQDDFEAFTRVVVDQARAMGISTDVIDEMITAMTGVSPKVYDAAASVGEADRVLKQMAARGDAAKVLKDVGDNSKTATPTLRDMADALASVHSRLLEVANPAFAAAQAQERLKAAQEKYQEVLKDSKSTDQDVAAAKLDVANATLEADAAAAEFGKNKDKGIYAIADAFGETFSQAEDLLQALGLLDENGDIVINVSLHMDPADQALLNSVATTTSGAGHRRLPQDRGFHVAGARASGGRVDPFEAYTIGERGPETLVMGARAGYVLPTGDSGGAAVSAGPTFGDIKIDARGATDPDKVARTVVRKLSRELRIYQAGQNRRI